MRLLSLSLVALSLSVTLSAPAFAARIASRGTMTCAVRPSGVVSCWGRFASDTQGSPMVPTVRARDATAVVVGSSRACALSRDGAVLCWGGDGVATAVAGLTGVRALAGGAGPLCALMSDRSVRCADATASTLSFAPIAGVSGAQQIVAGQSHACARTSDGGVRCWGDGTYNQLGHGRYEASRAAVSARLLGRVTDLAAGDDFTCGRAADGQVRCVGYRFDATGSPRLRTAWTPTVLPRAESLFAGAAMVCGGERGGGVRCAGFDEVIAMGAGDYALSYPSGAISVQDAREVAIGTRSVCVLDGAGSVRCIGDDRGLALGGATGPSERDPARVLGVEGATRVVAAGNHSCAIVANGAVKCWGFDDPQDLFATTGERPSVIGRRPVATPLAGVVGATEVTTNGATTVVRTADGALSIWGAGPFEPMGRVEGTGSDRVLRVAPAPQRSRYALGIQHLCAVTREGAVECAGSGQWGQWGAGLALPSMSGDGWFRRSFDAVASLSSVSALASNTHTLCAVGRDASLRCWGQNATQSLRAQGAGEALREPALREATGPVQQVALGGIFSRVFVCALRRGGSVACWGANEHWQTGSSGPRDRGVDALVPIASARSIAAGTHHACAALTTGAVWCWGANQRAQGGRGPAGAPREVAAVRDAVEVAAGRAHSCARTQDGAVWCWGASEDGALGDGSSSYARDFLAVPFAE
jgi:alpha-tubulin suppressor-like RCC1 family protein